MKTLLITGASGLIGNFLVKYFAKDYKIVAAHNTSDPPAADSLRVDLTNREATLGAAQNVNPDIIIHAAGVKDVKLCEEHPTLARKINADTTKHIAEAAVANNSFLAYISSDYVFNGKTGMYREDSPTEPWTVYGQTKLQGEKEVQAVCKDYAICRTSGIYTYHEKNLFNFILNSLKNKQAQSYFTDVFNSATYLGNFADMLSRVLELGKTDIYHVAGRERINRFEFALKIADTFKCDLSLVKPLELGEQRRQFDSRPFDLSLDVSHSEKLLGMKFFDIKQGLQAINNETNIP